jgi:hypothetical protein
MIGALSTEVEADSAKKSASNLRTRAPVQSDPKRLSSASGGSERMGGETRMRLEGRFPIRFATAVRRVALLAFLALLQWHVVAAAGEAARSAGDVASSGQGGRLQKCAAHEAPDAPLRHRCADLQCCALCAEDDASIGRVVLAVTCYLVTLGEQAVVPRSANANAPPARCPGFLTVGSPRSPPAA